MRGDFELSNDLQAWYEQDISFRERRNVERTHAAIARSKSIQPAFMDASKADCAISLNANALLRPYAPSSASLLFKNVE